MKNHFLQLNLFIAVALLAVSSACGQAVPASTPTPAATATAADTATPAPTLQPGEITRNLTVNGQQRSYLLHIPPGMSGQQPVPVVFVFHGYDPEYFFAVIDIQRITGFNDLADKQGFLVVYPYGLSGSWNAGTCCGMAVDDKVDDTAFTRQILADLGTLVKVDPKRVYATGLSSGAMLAYRLACDMSDTFAAIAPVSGALVIDPCQPGQPVSIIHFHGLADKAVPFAGGQGTLSTGEYTFPPAEQGIAAWVKLDGCTASPQVDQQAIYTRTWYGSCQAGTEVDLYTIAALGGNSWPSPYVLPLSQMIWDFFSAHPKQ